MQSQSIAESVSVVVPVYNSQDSLLLLADRIKAVFFSQSRDFELILVDDGSMDRSWQVVCELATRSANIRGIRMLRNYGQHNALLCGIRAARHPIVVTMDDDLQNPPEEIPKLLAELESGTDVVYGTPFSETHGLLRNLASQITKLVLQNAMGAKTARRVSAFRAFRRRIAGAFDHYRSPCVAIDVLLTWGTSRFSAVPVRNDPRRVGKSNYTVMKLVVHAVNMVTGFSVLPLQVASMLGLAMTLAGVAALTWVLVRYWTSGVVVPGFAFLACLVSIFSGAQLFATGIIGEYIARIHSRTMDRPSYAIETTTEEDSEAYVKSADATRSTAASPSAF